MNEVLALPPSCKILLATTPKECEKFAGKILFDVSKSSKQFSVWALDLEWTVDQTNNTKTAKSAALLQMGRENIVVLFHLAHCGMRPNLIHVLQHPQVFKVGVFIKNDAEKLERDFDSLPQRSLKNMIDLRSLATLFRQYLNKELPKPINIRMGQWDVDVLSEEQKQYAALDVYSAYHIYIELMKIGFSMQKKKNA